MATDMIGEQIDASMDLIGSYMEMVKAGKLRILAIAGDKRLAALPDVPTLKEAGINFTAQPWYGFEGPKGMDPAIVQKLNEMATETLVNDPVNAKKLARTSAPRRARCRPPSSRSSSRTRSRSGVRSSPSTRSRTN